MDRGKFIKSSLALMLAPYASFADGRMPIGKINSQTGSISNIDITIDHTLCGSVDTSNYAHYIYISDASLKLTTAGGKVYRSDGNDILFYSDAGHTTLLNWTIVSYDSTNGILRAFVKIPTLTVAANVTVYMRCGDSTITTFQGGTGGYNSHYKFVLPDPSSPVDLTSNALAFTSHGGVTSGTGQIGGCGVFDGSTGYLSASDASLPSGSADRTVSFWANPAAVAAGLYHMGLFYGTYTNNQMCELGIDPSPVWYASNYGAGSNNYSAVASAWVRMTLTISGSVWTLAKSGTGITSGFTLTTNTTLNQLNIGAENGGGAFFNGSLNMIYVRDDAESNSEIIAHNNNETNPGNIGSASFNTFSAWY